MIDTVQEGRRPRPSWAHVATAATLALMLAAVFLREGQGWRNPGAPLLVFTLLEWAPLLVRNRWPVPVLVTTVAVSVVQLVTIPLLDADWESTVGVAAYQPIPIAAAVAAYAVAVRPHGRRWAPGIAAAVVLPLVSILISGNDHLWTALVMCNLVLDGTAAGAIVAGRRDRLARDAQERLEMTQREVEAERLRIARELHDVLAHHLTLVNAQAGVADYLVRTDPDAAAKALEGMTRHTRQALDELRATVGLLRRTDGDDTEQAGAEASDRAEFRDQTRPPLPTLARLPDLLDTVRSAGLTVNFTESGEPAELAPGADLAAYRIVQEAITNATKHAPEQPIDITLTWTHRHLGIRVANRVDHTAPVNTTGSGHGLLGMTERVRAAGGTITIDRPSLSSHEPSDEFVVTADLPTEAAASASTDTPESS